MSPAAIARSAPLIDRMLPVPPPLLRIVVAPVK
jgi:hypothetical protein